MDVQIGIVKNFAKDGKLIGNIKKAITTARKIKIPVIYNDNNTHYNRNNKCSTKTEINSVDRLGIEMLYI